MPESVKSRILEELETVRPYLQEDGGDVEFVDFNPDTGVAHVRLTGACKNCPMSLMTLRAGIERILKKNVPEIYRLESIR